MIDISRNAFNNKTFWKKFKLIVNITWTHTSPSYWSSTQYFPIPWICNCVSFSFSLHFNLFDNIITYLKKNHPIYFSTMIIYVYSMYIIFPISDTIANTIVFFVAGMCFILYSKWFPVSNNIHIIIFFLVLVLIYLFEQLLRISYFHSKTKHVTVGLFYSVENLSSIRLIIVSNLKQHALMLLKELFSISHLHVESYSHYNESSSIIKKSCMKGIYSFFLFVKWELPRAMRHKRIFLIIYYWWFGMTWFYVYIYM